MKMNDQSHVKLFKTIFDQTPISTQVFTPDGKTVMVNTAWEELWNVKFKQLGEYNILQDQQLEEKGIMPYIKRGFKGQAVMLPAIKYDPKKSRPVKGARERWLSARMYPIKDNQQKITHLVLQHEDITDRRLAHEALMMSEERFRTLTSHAPVGIFLTNKDGDCLFVNAEWSRLTGMGLEQAIGQGWVKALHPEDKKMVFDAWNSFAKKGKDFNLEYRFCNSKGKIRWVSGSAVAVKGEGKNVAGYIGTIVDVSERKTMVEDLKISEERLRLALEAGKIGVWDWEIENNVLTWTHNVYKIHGVKKATFDVSLESFKNLVHPDDRATVLSRIEKSLSANEEFNIEFRIITPKGDVRWVTTRAVVVFNENAKAIRMLGATTDITDQKKVEQEKNDFISMAAHELKTPITSMKMFVELLQRELAKNSLAKSKYFAGRISEQADRLAELTSDLLDVSRLETGKLQLRKESFDFSQLVLETVESLQTTTRHELVLKYGAKVTVHADKYRLYQVLVNLITNAIKYSPNEEKILISLRKKKGDVIVSIKDRGIGITNEKQARIFERLYQAADSKLITFPGLGLGLYITKEIIDRHKGKIWVKSKSGEGSTFYFSLPYIV